MHAIQAEPDSASPSRCEGGSTTSCGRSWRFDVVRLPCTVVFRYGGSRGRVVYASRNGTCVDERVGVGVREGKSQ